jgi:hypothetical protein
MEATLVSLVPILNEGRIKEQLNIIEGVPITIHLKPSTKDLRNENFENTVEMLSEVAKCFGKKLKETEVAYTFKLV